jgi:prepilin peptidase CpaA
MPLTPTLPIIVALGLASIAALADLRARRIPNWLTGGGLLLGLAFNVVLASLADGASGPLAGALGSVVGAALGFALLLPLYLIRVRGSGRAMGAGDIKLLAALGAIAGPQALVSIAFYSALAGAAQAIVILSRDVWLVRVLNPALALRVGPAFSGRKAPYAVAMAAGACCALLLPPLVKS